MLQPEAADIIHNCRVCYNLMQGVFHQIFIKGNVFRIIPPELFDVAVKTVALPRLGAAEMNDGSLRANGLIVQIVCGIRCPCGQVVDFGIKRKNSGKFFLQEKWLPGCVTIQIEKQYPDELGELVKNINLMSLKISQNEKMQTEFISSVSHELRTPLTAINGWGETILEDPTGDPEQLRRGIRIILNESRRLSTMVEELLEFSKMQDGRFTLQIEQVDLQAELEDAIFTYRELFRQEGIELEYETPEDLLPPIPGDPERLKQVFCNVLDNAAKHGGAGKRIVASIAREGEEQVIRVRDFGPGIPEAELPFVKQKFYKGTAKARGSGIGLAVTEEIVVLHGGTLDIASAVGEGTTVTVTLPSAKAEEALGITGAPSRTEEEP